MVAEASKSLNLGNNEIYADDGDGLWMGCSHGPVAGTLCEVSDRLRSPRDFMRTSDGVPLALLIHSIENDHVEAHTRREIPIIRC